MNSQCKKTISLSSAKEQYAEHLVAQKALMVEDVPAHEYAEKAARTAHGDARQLVRLVQCPQCSKPFSTPVTLPCGHTVCRECLPEPRSRANISYPNTPDRLFGIACPLSSCGVEHAAADCNTDVTVTKLMELIKIEIEKQTESGGPMYVVEVVDHKDTQSSEEKDGMHVEAHSRMLYGGRLSSAFAMAEMGELRYSSDVEYRSASNYSLLPDTGDDLDEALLDRLKDITQKELDCLVCYNTMLNPTTTSCGHTFCRRCLVRVMDHSSICPICRRGLHMSPSLQNKPSNTLLNSLLDGLCPEIVAARQSAVDAEEHTADEDMNLPLFVCTLSLPTMPTFLHVFEPRYRLMMRRCMEGNRRFGMVMYNRNSSPQGDLGSTSFLEYGTMLEIVNMELLRDGRSFIETQGVGRFRIRGHSMLDGYHVGSVERVEDQSLADEGLLEQHETTTARAFIEAHERDNPGVPLPMDVAINRFSTQELLESCMAFVRQMRDASAPWLSARIVQVYGEPPEDPAVFPYWFASVVPIAEEEKYVLLRTTRVRERLKIVHSWIRRIRGQRWPSGSACNIL